ncbi:MAG: SEC-C metal-binding domain-containing protein [Acidimicrobiales bacterium]
MIGTRSEEAAMGKVGRNELCPCGSRNKAKRCCYSPERLAEADRVRRAFNELCASVAHDLDDVTHEKFHELFHEAIHLPEADLTLQVPLPKVSSPEIEGARAALDRDDDAFDEALDSVAAALDTPRRRLDIAQAIVALKDKGTIDKKVAAVAVFDLSDGERSAVFISSVAESLAVSAGECRTPAGLLVAAR